MSSMNILTVDGYKDILEVTIGTEVVAFDMFTGEKITNVIEKIEKKCASDYKKIITIQEAVGDQDAVEECEYDDFTFYLVNGQYKLYKNQSIWLNGSQITHAKYLQIGDVIYDENDQDILITSIEETTADEWYRLTISGDHSYIADGLTLHNASRYWVGGTGNWSDTARWSATSGGASGASVPSLVDDAIFDSLSHTTNYTATVDAATRTCDNFIASAPSSGNLTLAGTQELQIGSSLTWYTGMVVSYTGLLRFVSNNTGNTIDTKNITFNGSMTIGVTGSGGTGAWTLASNYTQPSNSFAFNEGTFSTSTFAFSVRRFSSNNTNPRTLDLGSGGWSITGNGTDVLNVVAGTMNVLSSGSNITLTYAGATGTRSGAFSGALTGTANVNIYITGGTDTYSISTTSANIIDFTGFSGTIAGNSTCSIRTRLTLSTGCTVTYTGNITGSASGVIIDTKGKTMGSSMTFSSMSSSSTATIPSGFVTSSTKAFTIGNNWTVDATGQTITAGSFVFSGSAVKSLTLTGGVMNLTGTGTVFSATVPTPTITGGTINITDTSATQKIIASPGLTIPNFTISGDNVLFQSSCTVTTLAVNTAGRTTGLVFTSGITVTVSTFTTNGSLGNLAKISASTPGSQATLFKAGVSQVSVNYMSIIDSNAQGADWYAGTGSTDGGNNTGWRFTAPVASTIKTIDGLAVASVKTIDGLAKASVKTWNGRP